MRPIRRIAQCSCGALRLTANGEPEGVAACHCIACQRRTGSVLGVGAYYAENAVEVSGAAKDYVRPTDAGNQLISHFCPNCGATVYWHLSKAPGLVGVAVGAFADPTFPQPTRSVWEQSMHPWVHVDPAQQHFPKGRVQS